MSIRVLNPYSNEPLPWLRGNLHAHTTNSDGTRHPQTVIDEYAARGYGFLMISDHDFLTNPAEFDDRGMVLVPGNEVTANGPHCLHLDAKTVVEPNSDRQNVIDAINADSGVAILAHPNWEKDYAHLPRNKMEEWNHYAGIEVYNGVIRRLDGSPLATDRWDRLLGLGRKVWGYAHDDSHEHGDDGLAWNMVQTDDRSVVGVVEALRTGRFYASTGVTISRIAAHGRVVSVETENAARIVVHSDYGHREAEINGATATITVPEDASIQYIRFECWGPGETMAWTQPFFIEQA